MANLEVVREIHPAARIASNVKIGPYCVIGEHVTIGPNTTIGRHVTVSGHTSIGSGNFIDDGCVIGVLPQDLKYRGSDTLMVVGHNNTICRNVTMHIGTETGGYVTRVGNGNIFREGSHVAHDCFVDNDCEIGKNVQLAGHILVQDGAVIEALSGVHHFVTIGRYSRVGPRTPVRRDVPPFTNFYSEDYGWTPPSVRGINQQGISDANLKPDEEAELRRALYELFDDEAALQTKIEQLVDLGMEGEAAALCEFCQNSLRGKFGRIREYYRGKIPPEAVPHLSEEKLAELKRQGIDEAQL